MTKVAVSNTKPRSCCNFKLAAVLLASSLDFLPFVFSEYIELNLVWLGSPCLLLRVMALSHTTCFALCSPPGSEHNHSAQQSKFHCARQYCWAPGSYANTATQKQTIMVQHRPLETMGFKVQWVCCYVVSDSPIRERLVGLTSNHMKVWKPSYDDYV